MKRISKFSAIEISLCLMMGIAYPSAASDNSTMAPSPQKNLVRDSGQLNDTMAGKAGQGSASVNLTKDDPAILDVITQYYEAVSTHDTTALSTLMDPWNDVIENKILENNIVENYNNISTYSVPGLTVGEYVVFVYYEAKLSDIDTPAPSLAGIYLKPAADETLKIYPYNDCEDTEVSDYISILSAHNTVQALVTQVQSKFNEALSSDPDLKSAEDAVAGEAGTES